MSRPFCLGIGGSPRRKGNTDLLLQAALEGAVEAGARVETVYLRNLDFSPCTACEACHQTGECVLGDDMTALHPRILSADYLVVAAPIYSLALNAQNKMFVDRSQCWWAARYILKVPVLLGGKTDNNARALFISAAGSPKTDVFDCALRTIRYFFDLIGAAMAPPVLVAGVDSLGEVAQDPQKILKAKEAGYQLIKGGIT